MCLELLNPRPNEGLQFRAPEGCADVWILPKLDLVCPPGMPYVQCRAKFLGAALIYACAQFGLYNGTKKD